LAFSINKEFISTNCLPVVMISIMLHRQNI
jgi:hypothetical protein